MPNKRAIGNFLFSPFDICSCMNMCIVILNDDTYYCEYYVYLCTLVYLFLKKFESFQAISASKGFLKA